MYDHFWKGKKLNKNRVSLFLKFSLLNFHIVMKEEGNSLKNYFSKEVIKLNYMQYPAQQQQYGGNTRPVYQSNGWNNRIRPVSSIEEVRAASIDFDGSVFYFSDLANKRIYTKQINLDGTALLNMYELKETPMEQPQVVDTSNFITRSEFEDVMNRMKNYLNSFSIEKTEAPVESEPANQVPTKRSFDF